MSAARRAVRKAVEGWFEGPVYSLLRAQGFAPRGAMDLADREPLQLFRLQETRIDAIGCRISQRIGVEKSELCAETGVFLRSVPHYSGAVFVGVDGLPIKSTLDCHFRRSLKPRWLVSPSLSRSTSWAVEGTGPHLDRCLADIYTKIEDGLPWFRKFDDLSQVYSAVLEKKETGTKLPGSWGLIYGEALVKGFLGLECGDWAHSAKSLAAALAMKNPHHSLDQRQPTRLYHMIESRIEEALRRAEHQLQQSEYDLS